MEKEGCVVYYGPNSHPIQKAFVSTGSNSASEYSLSTAFWIVGLELIGSLKHEMFDLSHWRHYVFIQ